MVSMSRGRIVSASQMSVDVGTGADTILPKRNGVSASMVQIVSSGSAAMSR